MKSTKKSSKKKHVKYDKMFLKKKTKSKKQHVKDVRTLMKMKNKKASIL